jgi:hypothetical protein
VGRSKIESWTSLIAHCGICVLLAAGCGDDALPDAGTGDCPGDGSADCPDAGGGESGSGAGRGGSSGSGGSGGSGGSVGGSGSGGSAQPDDDGGAEPQPQPDGGMPTGGPPTDGSQLSACGEDDDCTEDRVCYLPGAQQAIGYCTGTCSEDADCSALGAAYTCNAMGSGNMEGMCRIECEGPDDTSCPDMMMCVETSAGSFRCAYTEEPEEPPAQDMQLWEPCEQNGDCVAGLICYPEIDGGGGNGNQGGGEGFGGYCTQPCESTEECTEPEPSGNISPTCGSSNGCRFECSEDTTCPDGMECMDISGTSRCLYPVQ